MTDLLEERNRGKLKAHSSHDQGHETDHNHKVQKGMGEMKPSNMQFFGQIHFRFRILPPFSQLFDGTVKPKHGMNAKEEKDRNQYGVHRPKTIKQLWVVFPIMMITMGYKLDEIGIDLFLAFAACFLKCL